MSKCVCCPIDPSIAEGTLHFYECVFCGHDGAHLVSRRVAMQAKARENAAPAEFHFNGTCAWSSPHVSIAGGCHPSQSKEFNQALKDRGIQGVYFNEKGEREESSRKARKEANQAFGLVDFDGTWSD